MSDAASIRFAIVKGRNAGNPFKIIRKIAVVIETALFCNFGER